ncbi:MAG TPA: DUF5685 family protein [Acidobacteriota bacterium]|nr:DUF5685 family protein [Acidobacteriota bacterium]HNG91996.1 DUF5685 family protein [Acidobacteriota bacterium]
MFGLMKARTCAQPPAQRREHRLHYCGTCKTIGRQYGQSARFLLNFDTVFLAEVLTALGDQPASLEPWAPAYQSFNCLTLPRTVDEFPLPLHFAATATVVLAEFKVQDHLQDNSSWSGRVAATTFSTAFQTAAQQLASWAFPVDELRQTLGSQTQREGELKQAGSATDPEAGLSLVAEPTAHATGLFFRHGARLLGATEAESTMYSLGQAFGTLIYLLDALEDFEKDQRRGDFNAFQTVFAIDQPKLTGPHRAQAIAQVRNAEARMIEFFHQLPLSTERIEQFTYRLRSNLASRLGTRLPVVQATPACSISKRKTWRERLDQAVTFGKSLAAKEQPSASQSPMAKMKSSFVMASVVPIVFLFPQQALTATSSRECFSLGMNLMFAGAVLASIGSIFQPIQMAVFPGLRNRRRRLKEQIESKASCCRDCHCCCRNCQCCPDCLEVSECCCDFDCCSSEQSCNCCGDCGCNHCGNCDCCCHGDCCHGCDGCCNCCDGCSCDCS